VIEISLIKLDCKFCSHNLNFPFCLYKKFCFDHLADYPVTYLYLHHYFSPWLSEAETDRFLIKINLLKIVTIHSVLSWLLYELLVELEMQSLFLIEFLEIFLSQSQIFASAHEKKPVSSFIYDVYSFDHFSTKSSNIFFFICLIISKFTLILI